MIASRALGVTAALPTSASGMAMRFLTVPFWRSQRESEREPPPDPTAIPLNARRPSFIMWRPKTVRTPSCRVRMLLPVATSQTHAQCPSVERHMELVITS